jgi:MFS family permease
MSALTAAAFVLTWFRIRAFEAPSIAPSGGLLRGIPAALRGSTPAGRALLVASTLLGFGVGVAIAFQIPTMTAAGLAAGTAAALASFRALMQLGGRLPLTPLVLRFGSRRTLVGAYVVGAAGFVALAVADRWWVGAVFAVLAGAGYGAVSPLHGMVGAEEFEGSSMGALLGVQALVSAVGSALGPAVAGLLRDRTGSFVPGTLASAVVVLIGAVVLGTAPPSRRT